jgi:hypothetical protein
LAIPEDVGSSQKQTTKLSIPTGDPDSLLPEDAKYQNEGNKQLKTHIYGTTHILAI